MIHYIKPGAENLHGHFSRERKPILTIDSGDTIVAGTYDAAWGLLGEPSSMDVLPETIALSDRADPENDIGICLTGPVAVRGAEPGMTLEVEIEDLRVGAYGITMIGTGSHERYARLGLEEKVSWMQWRFDKARNLAANREGRIVKMRPFLGCMGVAPSEPGYHSNTSGRRVGGNIDCRELTIGSKLYLPIEEPGALFSFGDGHAAQGDGEVSGWAIECPMEVAKLTLRVREDMPIKWPIVRTDSSWITFGFGGDLTEAMYIALNGMLDMMTQRLGVSRGDAAMLASVAVDLRITQIVNPTVGVHAVLADDALK